jgi:hypothetical protein
MSTAFDITDWHTERIAGFLEAIRGDHPSAEIECVIRHHDTDRVGQLSLSLTEKPASDFTARRCETCQTVPSPRSYRSPAQGTQGARSCWGKRQRTGADT